MGHIVSAKAFRIGWSTVWCDQWFVKKLYYSLFLHAVFRIRYYCIYVFSAKHFDRKAMFYSHFEVLRHFKNIHVEIYYYDGKWETEYEDYKFEVFIKHYNLDQNKDPETRKPFFLFASLKLYNVFTVLTKLTFKCYTEEIFLRFMNLFRFNKIKKIIGYLKEIHKVKKFLFLNQFNLYFIWFISIYLNAKNIISKTSIWKYPNRNTIIRRLYFGSLSERKIKRWAEAYSFVLTYFFELFTKFYKVNLYFFLTNNNCVNAKFLSRYIARKLRQGYPVKELLNPIRKELLFLMKLSLTPRSSYYKYSLKKYYHNRNNIRHRNSIYKSLLAYIFQIYRFVVQDYFNKEKTFFTVDMLLMSIWFVTNMENEIKRNIDNKWRILNNYINKGWSYLYKKIIFICIFEYKFFFNELTELFFPSLKELSILKLTKKFIGLLDFLYIFIYTNKISVLQLSDIRFDLLNSGIALNFNQLTRYRASSININRYMIYSYFNFHYYSFSKIFNVNYLKSRIKIHTKGNNLIGYKMYLSGRFSRKQRAGHYWFSRGRVPLNTITSFVDYGFFTLPLINSAITVKVWLYKSDDIENKHYLKLY